MGNWKNIPATQEGMAWPGWKDDSGPSEAGHQESDQKKDEDSMSVAASIRSIIANDSAVIALAGNRICVDFIPEDSILPAALLYISTETAYDCFDGFVGFDVARIRVEAYGNSRSDADALHGAIRGSLNGVTGEHYGTMIKGIGQNTGRAYLIDRPNDGTDSWLFRTIQTFEVTYNSF